MTENQTLPTSYTLKEYESIQEQVRATRDESRTIERNAILVIGAFWAFLIKETVDGKPQPIPVLAWWIPVLFSVLAAIRSAALGFKLESLSIYVREIEKCFLRDSRGVPTGWEHFEKRRGGFIRISSWVFWAILITVAVVAAVYKNHR